MKPPYLFAALCVASGLGASAAMAATNTWTGTSSTAWSLAGNWSGGVPTSADTALFTGAVPANQPNIGAAATVGILAVQSGGLTISSSDGGGGFGVLRISPATDGGGDPEIDVTGPGLTIINAHVGDSQRYQGPNLRVGEGAKLVINGDVSNTLNRAWSISAGTGTLVLNGKYGGSGPPSGAGNSGSYLFNCPQASVVIGEPTISNGCFMGGTTPEYRINQYGALTIAAGSSLSPGGDGCTLAADGYDGGNRILRVGVRSSSSIRAGVIMSPGAKLVMDLGNTLDSHDQIDIGTLADDFRLNGCDLVLTNRGGLKDGLYTLITESVAGSDYTGTFGPITYNGQATLTTNFSLTYNADSVVLTVRGMEAVPSEGTVVLVH